MLAEYAVLCLITASFFNMQMDELACFAPGILALASYNGPREAEKYLSLAEEVVISVSKPDQSSNKKGYQFTI